MTYTTVISHQKAPKKLQID